MVRASESDGVGRRFWTEVARDVSGASQRVSGASGVEAEDDKEED
jgi:hypothetical protein